MDPSFATGIILIVAGIIAFVIFCAIGLLIKAAVAERHTLGEWLENGKGHFFLKACIVPVWMSLHIIAWIGWICVGMFLLYSAHEMSKWFDHRGRR